jgi:ribosome-associated toxin RatA of RatAB toxin-antitoxin module
MAVVEKSVLVHFSAQQMFNLVRNVSEYPKFLPWCGSCFVQPIDECKERATVEIVFKGLKQSFSTINCLTLNQEIDMTLADGPFSHLEGTWRFLELTPQACKVYFRLEYEFSSKILEQLLGPVFSMVTNSFVDSFIKQAEVLYGSGG